MRGIISAGGYVPYRRLQRAEIAKTFGSGGGKGTRSVASYDEDTTTMGVEAARLALRGAPSGATPVRSASISRAASSRSIGCPLIHSSGHARTRSTG